MKTLLINWTQRVNGSGGVETMQNYFNKAIPNSELISGKDFKEGCENCKDNVRRVDSYLLERFKKEKFKLVRDAEFGGVLDISKIPQVVLFQNPYDALSKKLGIQYYPWILKDFTKNIKDNILIATSNFMANEMKKYNFKPNYVIPNCVDLDIFKKKDKKLLREKYKIPEKRIGIWIGAPNEVKNFQMLLNLMEKFSDIFWILITKEEFTSPYSNSRVFYNMISVEVSELLNCADFFILTSPIEGCNIAALEAMACNLPCILARAGYFWDFWDDRIGIYIKYNSFNEHAKAIEKINKIHTESRKVLLEQKLGFKDWKNKMNKVMETIK